MRRRLLAALSGVALSLLAGSLAFAALLSVARSAEAPWLVSASRSEPAAAADVPALAEAAQSPEPALPLGETPQPPLPLGTADGWGEGGHLSPLPSMGTANRGGEGELLFPLPLGEGEGEGATPTAEVAAFAVDDSAALASSAAITLQAVSHTFAVPRLVQGIGASTRIVVQNPDTDAADVTITVSNEGGQQAARQALTIPALGQATVRSDQLSLPAGFVGSAIVGADREIAVAVEETSGTATVAYGAVGRPAPVAAFPLVRKSAAASTTIALQNATDRAAEVTLTFSPTSGGAALSVPSISLPPFGSRSINLATITEIPEGFVGSAIARANNVAIAGAYVSPTSGIGYSGFSDGSEALLLPLSRQWRSAAGPTTIAVQNLGGTPVAASVVRHRAAGGSHPPEPLLLAPGAAATIAAAPGGQTDDVERITLTAPSGSRLAAVVEAGPSLVRGVPASSGASYLPHAAIEALFVQNLGQEEATIIFALFLDSTGATVASGQWTLAAGEAAARSARELGLPTGFTGGAIILGPAPLGVVAR